MSDPVCEFMFMCGSVGCCGAIGDRSCAALVAVNYRRVAEEDRCDLPCCRRLGLLHYLLFFIYFHGCKNFTSMKVKITSMICFGSKILLP